MERRVSINVFVKELEIFCKEIFCLLFLQSAMIFKKKILATRQFLFSKFFPLHLDKYEY